MSVPISFSNPDPEQYAPVRVNCRLCQQCLYAGDTVPTTDVFADAGCDDDPKTCPGKGVGTDDGPLEELPVMTPSVGVTDTVGATSAAAAAAQVPPPTPMPLGEPTPMRRLG